MAPFLMAGAAAKVDVFSGRAVVVSAVGAAEVVDGLAGEGFGGEAGAGDNDLAVFVLETGVVVWKLFIFLVGRRVSEPVCEAGLVEECPRRDGER